MAKRELIDQRTGQLKVILPANLYAAGLHAGLDMSGYAVVKPIPTIPEQSIYYVDEASTLDGSDWDKIIKSMDNRPKWFKGLLTKSRKRR